MHIPELKLARRLTRVIQRKVKGGPVRRAQFKIAQFAAIERRRSRRRRGKRGIGNASDGLFRARIYLLRTRIRKPRAFRSTHSSVRDAPRILPLSENVREELSHRRLLYAHVIALRAIIIQLLYITCSFAGQRIFDNRGARRSGTRFGYSRT
jgi:hypothetical protein